MENRGKIYPSNIEIKENNNCHTDKINFIGEGCRYMALYCNSFENLKEIRIELENIIGTITLPIFLMNKKVIFKHFGQIF